MADKSSIEWTDATWNPVTGCTKVSPGCDNCYAERIVDRFKGKGAFAQVVLNEERLTAPLKWRKPRRVFVNSMSDLFHDAVPDEYIARAWAVMAASPQHTYQVLTKRHGRMRSLLSSLDFDLAVAEAWSRLGTETGSLLEGHTPPYPLPNVWLGVSVEDQKWADIRIPALLDTPAAVRFLSCEPLLGPVQLPLFDKIDECNCAGGTIESGGAHERYCGLAPGPAWGGLHWVIVGGESGPGSRPMQHEWARSLRQQCAAAGVPFFFKQWGGRTPKANGRELDGLTWDEYPEAVRRG